MADKPAFVDPFAQGTEAPSIESTATEQAAGGKPAFVDPFAAPIPSKPALLPATTVAPTPPPKPFAPAALPPSTPPEQGGFFRGIAQEAKAIPLGPIAAITHGIPELVASTGEFINREGAKSISGIGQKIKEVFNPSATIEEYKAGQEKVNQAAENFAAPLEEAKKYHAQKTQEMLGGLTGIPRLTADVGKLVTEIYAPGALVRLPVSFALKTGSLLEQAGGAEKLAARLFTLGKGEEAVAKMKEASELAIQYQARVALGQKVSNVAPTLLFGVSQAQQTVDNAKAHGADPGIIPYITGAIMALTAHYGIKNLNKLFKLEQGQLLAPKVMDIVKSMGVNVSAGAIQNYLIGMSEKISGIRPEAQPVQEAIASIPTMAGVGLFSGVLAHGMAKTQEWLNKSADQEAAMRKSGTPTDMTKPVTEPSTTGVEVTPAKDMFAQQRAVSRPMTRAEKEYSDWWNQEMRQKETLRQSPEGRNALAEQLAQEAGRTATVPEETTQKILADHMKAMQREEDIKTGRDHAKAISEEMKGVEAANLTDQEKMAQQAANLKAALATEHVKQSEAGLLDRTKTVAEVSNNKKFGEWLGERVTDMNKETDGSGDAWLQKMADDYGIKKESKNFIPQLKRAITAEAKITEPKQVVTPIPTNEKVFKTPEITPQPEAKPVSVVEKAVAGTTLTPEVTTQEFHPETETIPKNQALKLVTAPVTEKSTGNDVMDVFEGVHHIAQQYGMELERGFQNLSNVDTLKIAQKVQDIWKGVTGSQLFKDTQNKNQEIKDKIAQTNDLIKQSAITGTPLTVPVAAETRGRKPKIQVKEGKVPALTETREETIKQLDDLQEEVGNAEPTEAEIKAIEPIAEEANAEIEKVQKRINKEKEYKPNLQTYLKAKRLGVEVRGKTWAEIEGDIENKIELATEGSEKEITGEVDDIMDQSETSPRLATTTDWRMLDDGLSKVNDAEEWKVFLDMHKTTPEGKSFAADLQGKVATSDADSFLRHAALVERRKGQPTNVMGRFGQVAEVLTKLWGTQLKNVPVIFVNNESGASRYSKATDQIIVNLNAKTLEGQKHQLLPTAIHESAHAISAYVVKNNPEVRGKIEGFMNEALKHANPYVQEIVKAALDPKNTSKEAWYIHANKDALISKYGVDNVALAYSFVNPDEFTANLWSSPALMVHLKGIKTEGAPAITLKQKVMRFLSSVLFQKVADSENYSMYEKSLEYVADNVFSSPINEIALRREYRRQVAQQIGLEHSLGESIKDIKDIMHTNIDIKNWQKFLPMWILGKHFPQAKEMMSSWMEGMRTLNRQLYQYEFTTDPETGKEHTKSFLELSNPFKGVTPEQKLFDRIEYAGDLNRIVQTRADMEKFNKEMNLNMSAQQLDKVEHAYKSINEHYSKFWHWYWDNVRQVACRPFEGKPWYTELREAMLENNTQITDQALKDVTDMYGEKEATRFVRARESMMKAWDSIGKSEASMVEGYAPRMRQQGAYRVNVYDKDGNIVDTQFGDTPLEAAKIKYQVTKAYPGHKVEGFHISTSPENVFQEFDKNDLQAFIKTITGVMEKGGEASDEQIAEFYQALSQNVANKFKPTGFRTHQIQRVGQAGEAIQGYKTENYHENYLAYIRNGAGSIRKMNFAFDANNTLRDLQVSGKSSQGELFNYLKQYRDDLLRNEMKSDKVISNVRSMAYLYYLAANIKASTVNLTQNAILGIPLYARAIGGNVAANYVKATKDMHQAMADIFKSHLGKTDQFTTEEKRDVTFCKDGW